MNNLEKIILYGTTIVSLLIPKFTNAQTITKHYFNDPARIEIVESLEKTTAKEKINPFVQPNDSTLNWYGSGDANNDSKVDTKDLGRLDSLINNTYQNPSDKRLKDRADINGDEKITLADKQTLENYLNGSMPYLPSQWNKLQTKQERLDWVKKMFAIDKTDTIKAMPDWVCLQFATQTHINFHGYNNNIPSLFDTTNNGRFNLPVYSVHIQSPPHGVNTILIGDESLNWNDWYWVEPQDDKPVIMGQWNLKKDSSEVWIEKINILWNDGYSPQDFIKFSIKDSVASLMSYDTNYVELTRQTTPVPVELYSFFVKDIIDDDVLLNWITLSETNNYGFDVERSRNKKDFAKIGFVKGKGTTNEEEIYNFTDKEILSPGDYYYRLKQVDFDGSFEYSNILEALVKAPEKFKLMQNYPNPFNPVTTIEYKIPKLSHVKLEVSNILGQKLETLVDENKSPGSYEVKFDGSKYSSGIYFYRLQTKDFIETKRMIFVK